MAATRSPRRLTRDARREQLVVAAMPVLAAQGFTEFSLQDVATPADVTRNLLYHYFPRGRADITLAVVERAGRELVGDWLTDDDLPLPDRLTANFTRMMAHALAPSDAWRIHRRARSAGQPELDEVQARNYESVISSISLNHLGTDDPPALVHLALTGFLAFGETVLDEARVGSTPEAEVMRLLADTLVATIQIAGSPSGA